MNASYSHSGGTDSWGCHTNHSNGDYHCHNPKAYTPSTIREPSSLNKEFDSPKQYCCKTCRTGKACGDSCISRSKTCHQGPGCACDG